MTEVLLVDDHPVNLIYLKGVIGRLPQVQITACTTTAEALELSTKHEWDLVIADYMMPEMNGLAFIRTYRAIPGREKTPVLMVTASSDPKVKYELLDLGVVDFLMKPFDPSELIARARNLISLHAATKVLEDHNAALKKGVQEMTLALANRERESLMVLARAAESRDTSTGFHLQRMAAYSRLIALQIGLSEEEAENIYLAAPMHDVGKIGVPDSILLKKGKLDSDEWTEMKRHTVYGESILGKSETPILKLGGVIALNHHEAWDGSGYPYGIKGESIPLAARIVAVADVFDALTSKRSYKEAWAMDAAISELQSLSGQRLDPRCVTAFMNCLTAVKDVMANFDNQ